MLILEASLISTISIKYFSKPVLDTFAGYFALLPCHTDVHWARQPLQPLPGGTAGSSQPPPVGPSDSVQGFGLDIDTLDIGQVFHVFQKFLFNLSWKQFVCQAAKHVELA